MLGNVLPIHDNPLRLAEEIAMLDVISGGRIVSGFVRGIGLESLAHNANPVHNRERFAEAHDLIVKAWTTPGPFRWEGKHFHYRVVNPWMVPLQKPHPPIWVPGIASPETIVWAAQHRYPYVALNTSLEVTPRLWQLYKDTRPVGYQATSENYGYAIRVCVADTDEQAYEQGRHFYWQLGRTLGVRRCTGSARLARSAAPLRVASRRRCAMPTATSATNRRKRCSRSLPGRPTRSSGSSKPSSTWSSPPGWCCGPGGPMSHATAMRCLELLGKE